MKPINNAGIEVGRLAPAGKLHQASSVNGNVGFESALKEAINDRQEIKFSKHAQLRMTQRNISLSQQDMEKIGDAVRMAGMKGVKDSLVLMDKVALIVNIPSKTVVTTVDGKNIKENIFTNIDGAVIL